MKSVLSTLCLSTALIFGLSSHAMSITIGDPTVCQDINKNHMTINTSWANSCLASGTANLTGSDTDLFANGTSWKFIEKAESANTATPLFDLKFTPGIGDATSITGTWELSSTFWDVYSDAALGFKFGSGGTPDEWFVFDIINGETSGDWTFFSVLMNGQGQGGLSHVNLYSSSTVQHVTEPASFALFGLGLLGLGYARRRASK